MPREPTAKTARLDAGDVRETTHADQTMESVNQTVRTVTKESYVKVRHGTNINGFIIMLIHIKW